MLNNNLGGAPSAFNFLVDTNFNYGCIFSKDDFANRLLLVLEFAVQGKFCFVGPLQGGSQWNSGSAFQGFALEEGSVPAMAGGLPQLIVIMLHST